MEKLRTNNDFLLKVGFFYRNFFPGTVIVYRINVRFKLLNFTIYIFTFFSLHYSGAFIIPGFWIFFSVPLSNILEAWFYFPLSPHPLCPLFGIIFTPVIFFPKYTNKSFLLWELQRMYNLSIRKLTCEMCILNKNLWYK